MIRTLAAAAFFSASSMAMGETPPPGVGGMASARFHNRDAMERYLADNPSVQFSCGSPIADKWPDRLPDRGGDGPWRLRPRRRRYRLAAHATVI